MKRKYLAGLLTTHWSSEGSDAGTAHSLSRKHRHWSCHFQLPGHHGGLAQGAVLRNSRALLKYWCNKVIVNHTV